MRRLLPALIASAVLTTGCEMLTPGGRTIKACRENLISNLKDRESYRQDSDPKVIQEEPDQPKVWGWYYNAKNSMGGYGDGSEVLCYQEESGRVIQQSFGVDDAGERRLFLAITSPKIQKEIADKKAAAEKAKAEREAKAAAKAAQERARANAAAAAARRIYNRNYRELTAFCKEYGAGKANDIGTTFSYLELGSFSFVENYRIKNAGAKSTMFWSECSKIFRSHKNEYGDVTPYPKAFNSGLIKFTDLGVQYWGESRGVICKANPRFCE